MSLRRSKRITASKTKSKLQKQKQKEQQMDNEILSLMATDVVDCIRNPSMQLHVLRETSIVNGNNETAINAIIDAVRGKMGYSNSISSSPSASFGVYSGSCNSIMSSWTTDGTVGSLTRSTTVPLYENTVSDGTVDTSTRSTTVPLKLNAISGDSTRESSVSSGAYSDVISESSSVIFIKMVQRTPEIKVEPIDN